jgi:NTP pyrophosphatase (non-canonical NTP hydrolase)
MTGLQTIHAEAIAEITAASLKRKYRAGQEEHGGDLWKKSLRGEIESELLDLICYWQTMDTQLEVIRKMLIAYREGEEVPADELESAIRLLTLK